MVLRWALVILLEEVTMSVVVNSILLLGKELSLKFMCLDIFMKVFQILMILSKDFALKIFLIIDYGAWSDGNTTYINASTCSQKMKPENPPFIFDLDLPEGVTKE